MKKTEDSDAKLALIATGIMSTVIIAALAGSIVSLQRGEGSNALACIAAGVTIALFVKLLFTGKA